MAAKELASAVSSSSWPGLSRPSTSLRPRKKKDVDARDKRGHDELLLRNG
jgi:hypothetical protein